MKKQAYGIAGVGMALAGLMCLGIGHQAECATKTWTGGGVGGRWSNSTNWTPNSAPVSADDIVFDGSGANGNKNATQDLAYTINSLVITNTYGGTNTQNADLTVATSFNMYTGVWQFTSGTAAVLTVQGDMYVNSRIYCQRSSTNGNGMGRIFTVNGNFTLDTNGVIDGTGLGFDIKAGPGSPAGEGGGGHGGIGGYRGGQGVGYCYGSITNPTSLGSGGWNGFSAGNINGGLGGGAVFLDVAKTGSIHGLITCDGGPVDAAKYSPRGGGAGGSIRIKAESVLGLGYISARGCAVVPDNYGPGGGGRIAIYYTTAMALPVSNLCATGAKNIAGGNVNSAAGTIYLRKNSDPYGTLIVDNSNIVTFSTTVLPTTLISNTVVDLPDGNILIQNQGKLEIAGGNQLVVKGYLTNSGAFLADTNSTVIFAPPTQTTVTTNNTFWNLTITNVNVGTTVFFEAKRTNTVQGTLTLSGQPGNLLALRSTGTNSYFKITDAAKPHSVQYVDVASSTAIGNGISAYNSHDSGSNVNWSFPASGGQTYAWTGTNSTNWSTAANWDQGQVPDATASVVISNPCTFYPTLDSAKVIGGELRVNSGAILRLGGYNLSVSSNLTVNGTLIASNSETILVSGNLDFTGGSFSGMSSTVFIGGTNSQTLTSGGNRFSTLRVTNTAALVRFTDDAMATNVLLGAGSVLFSGALTVGAALTNQGGTVTFGGAAAVSTLASAGGALTFSNTFMATRLLSTSATVTFKDNATIRDFQAYGQGTNTFNQGKVYSITNLWLSGVSNNACMTLRSSASGQPWNLRVSGMSSVAYVDVKDSDASGGLTIQPILSVNSGGNSNWDFGRTANWAHWVGGVSGSFTNPANWSPAVAPDSGLLFIDGNYTTTPRLTNALTVSNLVVGGYPSATLIVDGALTVLEDMVVAPSGVVTHTATSTNGLGIAVNRNLSVLVDGQINVTGKGYGALGGPGAGKASQGGGGHGGEGGYWNPGGGGGPDTAGGCYDSISAPVMLGSGGDSYAGGGTIRITVGHTTRLDGTLAADGQDFISGNNGAGAGGSVWLVTDTLEGTGTIEADGGRGNTYGHGGGGRVAIQVNSGSNAGAIALSAASRPVTSGGGKAGGAGSVYLKTAAQAYGTCIVDNKGETLATRTIIDSNVTDTVVGDLILRNAGTLWLSTNQSFTVMGSFSNASSLCACSNSTVILTGTNTATVYTPSLLSTNTGTGPLTNIFWNLTCSNSPKQIFFQAGRTNIVRGLLTLYGVTLDSTTPGSKWYLRLDPTGTQFVKSVSVQDSSATNGQTIVALAPSLDRSNNINWFFARAPGSVFKFK